MATTLPQVKVGPAASGIGFTAWCSACAWTIYRQLRIDTDFEAVEHRASHQTPLHEDDDTPWRID